MDSISTLSKSIATLEISETSSHKKGTESSLAADLRQGLQRALEEIDTLAAYAKKKKQVVGGIQKLRNSFESELQFVEKNSAPDREHCLSGTNTHSIVGVWAAAKRCTGVVALRINCRPSPASANLRRSRRASQECHTPGVVAEGGLEWVKVSLRNERRILFELAKEGFGANESDSDPDEQDQPNDTKRNDNLLGCAKFLFHSSQVKRVDYKRPTIRMVLPSIRKGGAAEVEKMLKEISAMGIIVQTAEDIPEDIPLSADILSRMLSIPTPTFTDTINVDVNAMLSFVSCLAHTKIQHDDSYKITTINNIKTESKSPIMPTIFWPTCSDRKMVCTRVAADKFLELVNMIGTYEERVRASLLLRNPNDKNTAEMTQEERIKAFQALSIHDVPPEWNLPIEIDDIDITAMKSKLSVIHEEVCKVMPSKLHQSVFLYGWANGLTTITSNQAMARSIERTIEKNRILDEDVGPDIWTTGSCRPLFGESVEKRKRGWRN